MQILFNPNHLSEFKSVAEQCTWVASRRPRAWAIAVGASPDVASALPDQKIDRGDLKRICADPRFSPQQCFLAIMAWGGMRVDHGALAWRASEGCTSLLVDLRNGKLSRAEAYRRFHQFRRANPRCGMGPAYYTKLIFFASPRHDGYIMDQWTALGINLLTDFGGEPVVRMTSGQFRGRRWDRVADSNDAEAFESFCQAIERLSSLTGLSPEAVEKRLFSQGGRNAGVWRRYVVANRPPLPQASR